METLKERLTREAREHLQTYDNYNNTRTYQAVPEDELDTLISHTISETLKEAVRVIEGIKNDYPVDAQPTTKEFEMRINWAHPVVQEALSAAITAVEGLGKTGK